MRGLFSAILQKKLKTSSDSRKFEITSYRKSVSPNDSIRILSGSSYFFLRIYIEMRLKRRSRLIHFFNSFVENPVVENDSA